MMDVKFIAKCDREIIKNNHKGDWKEYKPSRKKIIQELAWHDAKLKAAVLSNDDDMELIQELAADVANICEKIFEMAAYAHKTRKKCYNYYGEYIGMDYTSWEKAKEGEK